MALVVEAHAPARAREAVAAQRAASRAAVTVKVRQMSGSSARGAGLACPTSAFGAELQIKMAPVLADLSHPQSGLLLTGEHVVVCDEEERGTTTEVSLYSLTVTRPTRVVCAWGAEATLVDMEEPDWHFVLQAGHGTPVPAYVTSQPRALAYYAALQPATPEAGLERLQRWGSAIAAVVEQVEVLESIFGGPAADVVVQDTHVSLTGEQVLRSRDRTAAHSWCRQARTIANAAKGAHRRAAKKWSREQEES
jgi:hypothetical protein